jgi:hypothetical protein
MLKPKSKGSSDDSFSVFLDTVKKSSVAQSVPSDFPASEVPAGILPFLSQPKAVGQLLDESGMGLDQLAATLRTLKEAGLIKADGFGANDVVELTEIGHKLLVAPAFVTAT